MKKKLSIILLYITVNMHAGVHVVTNTNDAGAGSLRQAIIDANADGTSPRVIQFSIGTGVQTIQPNSGFPAIVVDDVLVDGTTQPGWSAGNPVIILDGSLAAFSNGLTLQGVDNCTIQALVFNNWGSAGIAILNDGTTGSNNNAIYGCFVGIDQAGSTALPNNVGINIEASVDSTHNGNIIGGPSIEQRNVLSGNTTDGIALLTNVNTTQIVGNYIGLNSGGFFGIGNGAMGIHIVGTLFHNTAEMANANIIDGNVISGNGQHGINLMVNIFDTIIRGNIIGIDANLNQAVANNGSGIYMDGFFEDTPVQGTIIGGSTLAERNIIGGNASSGIHLLSNVHDSVIQRNLIGGNFGNNGPGISIEGTIASTNNLIGGLLQTQANRIFNNAAGVFIDGDINDPDILNPVLGNSIFANNGSMGIELINGGNNMQEAPIIMSAMVTGNQLTIQFTAPVNPAGAFFRIEFFANTSDISPNTEGRTFIGAVDNVPAGAELNEVLILQQPFSSNTFISATATNLNNTGGTPGDTSEFGANLEIVVNQIISAISQAIISKYCIEEEEN